MLHESPWGWAVIGFLFGGPIWAGLTVLAISIITGKAEEVRRNQSGEFVAKE